MSLRLIKILTLLPRAPRALTSREILDKVGVLRDAPSLRTIQRDLESLLDLPWLGLDEFRATGLGDREQSIATRRMRAGSLQTWMTIRR